MRIFAHRGASAQHPENTVAAFRAAVALGADGVELDVRFDAGAALVVHHDPVLADGRVVATLGPTERPADLCELATALDACGELEVNLELKADSPGGGPALVAPVLELLAGWGGQALVSCFDPVTVDEVHRLAPELPTAQLTAWPDRSLDELVPWVAARGHVAWHPHDLLVDAASMALARAAGLAVNVWTVNDAARIAELAALGVDAVFTDDVPTALAALGRAA
jgi:glycerophosphoryl diester phosphodiesterase